VNLTETAPTTAPLIAVQQVYLLVGASKWSFVLQFPAGFDASRFIISASNPTIQDANKSFVINVGTGTPRVDSSNTSFVFVDLAPAFVQAMGMLAGSISFGALTLVNLDPNRITPRFSETSTGLLRTPQGAIVPIATTLNKLIRVALGAFSE
jgi:hypothetical protein